LDYRVKANTNSIEVYLLDSILEAADNLNFISDNQVVANSHSNL